jgi:hypothetical protein
MTIPAWHWPTTPSSRVVGLLTYDPAGVPFRLSDRQIRIPLGEG